MSRDIRVKLEWNIHGWTGWRRAARKRGKRSTTSCINGLSVSDNDNHVHRARRGGGGRGKEEKRKKNNNKRREKRGIAGREGKEVRGEERGKKRCEKNGDSRYNVRCLDALYYLRDTPRTYLELP